MTSTYTEVPPSLVEKYKSLRKDSKFKVNPEGYHLFIGLFTGFFDGDEISAKQIAQRLGISKVAVLKTKRSVNQSLEVNWKLYDLPALNMHFKALKDVADTIPDTVYRTVDEKDGSTSLVEVETSSTKWIAKTHRDIYRDSLEMLKQLKEETKHAAWEQGGRRYFDSRAYTTYALFMEKVRLYGRDWLDLFGRLEESAITDAILKRKHILEHTMDFLLDHMGEAITPQLVSGYVDSLADVDEPVSPT